MSELKKQLVEQMFGAGPVNVHVDARRDGVIVPEHFRGQPNLVLAIGRKGLAIPIPDLVVDDQGVRGTLSFKGKPFACTLPWSAVYALVDESQKGRVFEADVPPDLPRPAAHESECSFCLAPKKSVKQLVSCPRASICDRCIRRHRRRDLIARLRKWLVGEPRERGEVVAMPYRGLPTGCSFCEDTHVPTIAGARARICDPCLELASDALPRD